MPFAIAHEPDFARVVLAGRLTASELVSAAKQLDTCHTAAGATPHRLIDITAVENMDVSFSEMYAFSSTRRNAILRNRVKTAIVATTTVQFGLARMFSLLNSQPQTEVAVFRDTASAVEWISADKDGQVI